MKIGKFYSHPKHNFFAPSWEYHMGLLDTENPKLVNDLKNLILTKEQQIITDFAGLGQDAGTGLGVDALTSKYQFYNIFAWTEEPAVAFTKLVVEQYCIFLKEFGLSLPTTWGRCWANVLRNGQSIGAHNHGCHSYSYLSGHFVIAAENTGTYYQNPTDPTARHREENIPGRLTFFPSYITHWTDNNNSPAERITIAFDLYIADEEFRKLNHYGYFRGERDAPEVKIL
jgi:hypothetical protein